LSPELSLIIHNSFIKYPCKYPFELDNKPVSDTTLLNWLRKITKINKISFDMMRSEYITWFYRNNKIFGARETLSRQMRHAQPTASKNYLKVFDEEPHLIITSLKNEKIF
jgi:integrase